jgi:hypothetical protein
MSNRRDVARAASGAERIKSGAEKKRLQIPRLRCALDDTGEVGGGEKQVLRLRSPGATSAQDDALRILRLDSVALRGSFGQAEEW